MPDGVADGFFCCCEKIFSTSLTPKLINPKHIDVVLISEACKLLRRVFDVLIISGSEWVPGLGENFACNWLMLSIAFVDELLYKSSTTFLVFLFSCPRSLEVFVAETSSIESLTIIESIKLFWFKIFFNFALSSFGISCKAFAFFSIISAIESIVLESYAS